MAAKRAAVPPLQMTPSGAREPLLTPDEAAQYLGVSRWTLRSWVALKRIEVVRYSEKCVRFRRSALDRFIARRTESAEHGR